MLPLSQFWRLVIVMPAAKKALSLETEDAMIPVQESAKSDIIGHVSVEQW